MVREWSFGRVVRERFVGVRLSSWPEYRRVEWDCHICLGPVSALLKVVTPSRDGRRTDDLDAVGAYAQEGS